MSSLLDGCTCGVCDGCQAGMNDFLCDSLCEIQAMCLEIGIVATFKLRDEENISRDDYNSIKEYEEAANKEYSICACDITYNPNQKQLERAGLYEESEVIVRTPTKCWLDNGLVFRDIDIKRTTVKLGEERFHIKEKSRDQVIMGTVPIYYTFGLVKN